MTATTKTTPAGHPLVTCPECGREVRGRRDGTPVKHSCEPAPAAAPAKTTRPEKTARPARRPAAKRTAVPADFPGAAKAARLAEAASETGWTAEVRTEGATMLVVTVRRGGASIVTTLTDGKLDLSRMPLHTRAADARPIKLRNVSAALAAMAAPVG